MVAKKELKQSKKIITVNIFGNNKFNFLLKIFKEEINIGPVTNIKNINIDNCK